MTPANNARIILSKFRGIILVLVVLFNDTARGNT